MPKGVYPRTPEHGRKIAAAKRGKPRSPHTVRRMSAAMQGHRHSDETKAKIGAAARGRSPWNKGRTLGALSAETKAKISVANTGRRGAKAGIPLTAAQKQKIAEGKRQSGYHHSAETRQKLSDARRRRHDGPLSEDHKRKIADAHRGKPLSAAHRRKLSEAHRGQRMTPETQAKASAALQGKTPWNKGRTLSAATRAKMRARTVSPETRAKISAGLKGRPHTAEHNAKVSAAQQGKIIPPAQRAQIAETLQGNVPWNKEKKMDEAFREKCRRRPRRSPEVIRRIVETRRASGGASRAGEAKRRFWAEIDPERRDAIISKMVRAARQHKAPTVLERETERALQALGIAYHAQYPLGRFRADFFLPDFNVDLECDGSYWHGRPDVQAKDVRRDKAIHASGYRVIRLAEDAIRQNAEAAVRDALETCHPE